MPPQPRPDPVRHSADLAAFLAAGHTQREAAAHYSVSDRTIRNWLKAAGPTPVTPARQVRLAARRPSMRRIGCRPAHASVHTTTAIAPHLVAGPRTEWRAWDGELRPVVPGTMGAAWNVEQERQRALSRRKAEAETLPPPPMKAETEAEIERELPEKPEAETSPEPVAEQVPVVPFRYVPGRRLPDHGYKPSIVGLAHQVLMPGPVLAILIAVLLIWLVWHGG